MSILIDTHVFLWATGVGDRLSESARKLLDDEDIPIFFSAASAWELTIKWSQGRLELPEPPSKMIGNILSTGGISQLPVSIRDAVEIEHLPFHHKDPFDRMLVAQARTNGLRLMTADPILERYDVDVIALWVNDDE